MFGLGGNVVITLRVQTTMHKEMKTGTTALLRKTSAVTITVSVYTILFVPS